jgi:hypothetical protein
MQHASIIKMNGWQCQDSQSLKEFLGMTFGLKFCPHHGQISELPIILDLQKFGCECPAGLAVGRVKLDNDKIVRMRLNECSG